MSMEGSSKGLRKGAWTSEEDNLLRQCVNKFGEGKWHQVPLRAGLNRCRKSCRLRWLNYLKPSIKRGKLSSDEVDLLLRLHRLLGNRWSLIAGRLPGRTANDVKNYWNTHLSKKHEPCCKMNKRNITSPLITPPVQKVNVFKPRPRSFTVNNDSSLPQVEVIPDPCHGFNNNIVSEDSITCNNNNIVCEDSITSNNDVEKDEELVNDLMGGDNMWLESLLEESQETEGAAATVTANGETLAFDVEQLWSLLDGDTVNLN